MKKILYIFLVVLLFCSSAIAEVFTLRNGVQFGMTLNEIEKLEPLKRVTSTNKDVYMYGYGIIANIDDSGVEYHFDKDGKLYSLELDLASGKKQYYTCKQDYEKINSMLKDKYGAPLGNKNASSYFIRGKEFSGILSAYSLFQMMSTGILYDEWIIENEFGYMKIDHSCFYKGGDAGHFLEYTFFTDEDIKSLQNDI